MVMILFLVVSCIPTDRQHGVQPPYGESHLMYEGSRFSLFSHRDGSIPPTPMSCLYGPKGPTSSETTIAIIIDRSPVDIDLPFGANSRKFTTFNFKTML